tara:strand:- start:1441 stop:1626 length:186 start_codon:yes stop_codon:yes gene_type:complete
MKIYSITYWNGQEIVETLGAGKTNKEAKENCKAQHLANSQWNRWPISTRDIIKSKSTSTIN